MMTNDELKKKIAKIIADYFCPQRNEHKSLWGDDRLCYSKTNFAECEWVTECTDALIAAGIGDVKEAEYRAEKYERALELMARSECTFASPEYYIKQAEKELTEEGK